MCMKKCNKCNELKSFSEFQKARIINDKIYYRQYCTRCKVLQQKNRLKNNKEIIYEIKKNLKCSNCGINDYRVIDFHHTGEYEKINSVSNLLLWGFSLENIKKEIDKCIPLCANCHRILHYEEFNNDLSLG